VRPLVKAMAFVAASDRWRMRIWSSGGIELSRGLGDLVADVGTEVFVGA
jgi:hypothetical protein